jgi:phenylacetate-CoA ligase
MIDLYHSVEGADPKAILALQDERLSWTVDHAHQNSSMYRKILDDAGIITRDIRGVQDLESLPFTTKDDLRSAFPREALATGIEEVSYFGITSGTTGNPILVYLTGDDAKNMASSVARAYHALGMGPGDVGQIMVAVPMAWMWENSFRSLGMGVFNAGIGNAHGQASVIRDLGSTILVSTPSYLLHLAEAAADIGFDPVASRVRILIAVAEPFGEETRSRLETAWGAEAFDGYGCMEMANGFVECPSKNGHHTYSDHYICEVVDPVTGEAVEDGERGELVFTTLTRRATPLIRYRTRDLVHIESSRCTCGRTHPRIFLHGRMDDMVKVKGSSVYPEILERAVMALDRVNNYQAVVEKSGNLDTVTLNVEATDPSPELEERLSTAVKAACNVTPRVVFVEPGSLSAGGKTKRLLDKRK